eukprot:CAMPEP_0177454362 /NCGR_PEP_ID=MMETSP0369-20130122/11335_1 /TAXON_ID=447022 ORGANISM="Scrippsiella hangoei-like, Strain SHHI-4" /NCGR_SAMPLE_ID=MMETSP0369 /ASSEMBLY_ACC=CAM_ASM_000364 /LENGTH=97 /DNA_ID=CAMNT_0018927165 /DNA_START=36 /DNA_END=325 /DNA_ORIENTATION=-
MPRQPGRPYSIQAVGVVPRVAGVDLPAQAAAPLVAPPQLHLPVDAQGDCGTDGDEEHQQRGRDGAQAAQPTHLLDRGALGNESLACGLGAMRRGIFG